MKSARADVLPASLRPLGISREQAAAFIGISPSLLDRAVDAGTMPRPRLVFGRNVWDVDELIASFKAMPHKGGDDGDDEPEQQTRQGNPWDEARNAE